MNKIILCIKKLFAIIISFIFSLFYDDNKIEKTTNKKEELISTTKNKKLKSIRTIRDDDESTKSISNKNTDIIEILFCAKIDIQKLFNIQKNIIDLEYQINITTSLEDLYLLQKELEKEKNKLEHIAIYYDKLDYNYKVIRDIKQIVSDSKKLIKDEEKNLDKKIYKEEHKKEESKEEIKEEQKQPEKSAEENKDILKEIELEKQEDKKIISPKLPIVELITIKEISEILTEKKKNKNTNNSKDKSIYNENIKSYDKNLVVKVEKKDKKIIYKTKEVVNKQNIDSNINKIKKKNNANKLAIISLILAKASSLVQNANCNSLLRINPMIAVNNSLIINNEIRRARSINNRKVKKLKLDKVIKRVGNDPRTMVKAIMVNSLSEIKKLKAQLQQYDVSDELIEAIANLNDIELEIINQIEEMENVNDIHRIHSR